MRCSLEIVDEEYIEEVKDKSENENTKQRTKYWRNVFKKWENKRNFQANLEGYYIFRTSVILASIFLTSNCNGSA